MHTFHSKYARFSPNFHVFKDLLRRLHVRARKLTVQCPLRRASSFSCRKTNTISRKNKVFQVDHFLFELFPTCTRQVMFVSVKYSFSEKWRKMRTIFTDPTEGGLLLRDHSPWLQAGLIGSKFLVTRSVRQCFLQKKGTKCELMWKYRHLFLKMTKNASKQVNQQRKRRNKKPRGGGGTQVWNNFCFP